MRQVEDPTTDQLGVGAGAHFIGARDAARNFSQSAGVCEGRPGVIESSNIDPLNENSNKGVGQLILHPAFFLQDSLTSISNADDGWANAKSTSGTGTGAGLAQGAFSAATSVASGAASMASGVAQSAYKYVAGDEKSRQAGKESSA